MIKKYFLNKIVKLTLKEETINTLLTLTGNEHSNIIDDNSALGPYVRINEIPIKIIDFDEVYLVCDFFLFDISVTEEVDDDGNIVITSIEEDSAIPSKVTMGIKHEEIKYICTASAEDEEEYGRVEKTYDFKLKAKENLKLEYKKDE